MSINENTIEQRCLVVLQELGWQYCDGRTILSGGENPWRGRASEVVFAEILAQQIAKLNPHLPACAVDDVLTQVRRVAGNELIEQNQCFYDYLCNGVKVSYQQAGETCVDFARLVDFQQPENNRFDVVNQLSIQGTKGIRRPDVICYLNGLPIVVFELKNPLRETADMAMAFNQLQTYQQEISDLFVFNQILVIGDGVAARFGSLTANLNRFNPWRVVDEKNHSQRIPFSNELEAFLQGVMPPQVLLNYLYHFIVFERGSDGKISKKIGAYHQFYGVNEALDCTLQATQAGGDGRIGVMWHTQGSGKSLSMLFYARKLLAAPELQNPTIVVVTDRNDLDGQLYATFCAGQAMLKTTPIQAEDREDLRQKLAEREAGGIIFTTIQKFALLDGEARFPMLNSRRNIIVISDEAHRSQYGFEQQQISQDVQQRRASFVQKTGYAQNLRHALPNGAFIGFTGTPISLEDRDTQAVFGRYVSIYDLQDAVTDGATVPIMYEARQIPLQMNAQIKQLLSEMADVEEEASGQSVNLLASLIGADERQKQLALDLVQHYEKRTALEAGKAMIVCVSRQVCVKLYQQITALRPDWHSDNVMAGKIKIMMTGNAGDTDDLKAHLYSKEARKQIENRFKNPEDPLGLVIVCDMWLTGFDAPCCNTMYLDKRMKGHNLAQAIARVNRVFRNKSPENGGLIVDYLGLSEELKAVMREYSRANGKGEMVQDVYAVLEKFREHLMVIRGQFATPVNQKKFALDQALQLTDDHALFEQLLLGAEHIASLDWHYADPHSTSERKNTSPRKNAFLNATRLAKKGYQLCGSLPEIKPYEKELAFYDNVRAILVKNDKAPSDRDDSKRLDLVKLLNQNIEAQGAINLLELLGQGQPNLNILSDEFLEMVKGSAIPNLWLSAVERYLRQEIREKSASNIGTRKDFESRLDEALTRYHNQNLTLLDVLNELIKMAKDFAARLKRGEALGLSPTEIAFYDALAQNESAVRELGDQVLRKLAQEITDKIRKSVTIDWQFKAAVRSQMRILVKRALKQYKYPPDQEIEAIEKVLEQAEAIADELTR